jgi:hypothetical protein
MPPPVQATFGTSASLLSNDQRTAAYLGGGGRGRGSKRRRCRNHRRDCRGAVGRIDRQLGHRGTTLPSRGRDVCVRAAHNGAVPSKGKLVRALGRPLRIRTCPPRSRRCRPRRSPHALLPRAGCVTPPAAGRQAFELNYQIAALTPMISFASICALRSRSLKSGAERSIFVV